MILNGCYVALKKNFSEDSDDASNTVNKYQDNVLHFVKVKIQDEINK